MNRSLGGTYGCRQSPLQMRKQACEKINAMFGTDISVDFAEPQLEEMGLSPIDEEEFDDE